MQNFYSSEEWTKLSKEEILEIILEEVNRPDRQYIIVSYLHSMTTVLSVEKGVQGDRTGYLFKVGFLNRRDQSPRNSFIYDELIESEIGRWQIVHYDDFYRGWRNEKLIETLSSSALAFNLKKIREKTEIAYLIPVDEKGRDIV